MSAEAGRVSSGSETKALSTSRLSGQTPSLTELAAVPNPHAKATWHTHTACPWCRAYDEAQRLLAEADTWRRSGAQPAPPHGHHDCPDGPDGHEDGCLNGRQE